MISPFLDRARPSPAHRRRGWRYYAAGCAMWPPVIFFMPSAGSACIMSPTQLAIWAGLSFTQTRTPAGVLGLFGPGTVRVGEGRRVVEGAVVSVRENLSGGR